MQNNEAVVTPHKPRNSAGIGPVAVMAATRPDLIHLCELLNFSKDELQPLFISRLYCDKRNPGGFSVTGPFVGAPYAVMLLENLIVRGARHIIFLGWCGAISETVKIGDIVLPTAAVIDEGTSPHYGAQRGSLIAVSSPMESKIRESLQSYQTTFHEGTIGTTDAVYRETKSKVVNHQQNGILAVEMELSALFTVAQFRGIDIGGVLVVSDELSSLAWCPGFKQAKFKQSRRMVCWLIKELLRNC